MVLGESLVSTITDVISNLERKIFLNFNFLIIISVHSVQYLIVDKLQKQFSLF